MNPLRILALVLLLPFACAPTAAQSPDSSPAQVHEAAVVYLPEMAGRPELNRLVQRPGWVDLYSRGDSTGRGARLDANGEFFPPSLDEDVVLIANFDRMEFLPVIVPGWDRASGQLVLPADYCVYPDGYPDDWDPEYLQQNENFWQTFLARSTNIYSVTLFDATKIVWWGNKINSTFHKGGVDGPILMIGGVESDWPAMSGTHSNFEAPRMGWRHGDMVLEPGDKYAIRIGGYRSHGGERFELPAFVRPDDGNGYEPGQAYAHRSPAGGDLCFVMVGNAGGQIVENQIRSEEWEIMIPKRKPAADWGQSFLAHGQSLAGFTFWAAAADDEGTVTCEIRLRQGGPEGRVIGPVKTAVGRTSPERPIIRYPDWPGPLPGYESFYEPPHLLFQAAWFPDEAPLRPGETYYLDITADEPLMMFVDGDYYADGYGYYNSERIETDQMFHSDRWTIAGTITTYENPGGAPNDYTRALPPPAGDANLLRNPGAETGNFDGWHIVEDPVIDPGTHLPTPANHSGNHRFGLSVGWITADAAQYQEVSGIEPGARYRASMWVAHGDGSHEEAEILWIDGPWGGDEHLLGQTGETAPADWVQLAGSFTPSSETVTLVIRYKHPLPTEIASIHVDDIELRRVE